MNYIHIKKLHKKYNDVSVLHDIDLEINKGDIISIVGPSGSGKTTLVKSILGLEEYTGDIHVEDSTLSEYFNNKRIGYVPQRYANFEHLTVYQNLETAFDKLTEESQQKIQHILTYFRLDHAINLYPKDLSGGMKQRLAIARTLLSDSDIIIFDEPLSSLDEETKHKIQEFLLDIWAKHKKTFIFVTHDIEEAVFLSKKVFVLSANPGKIKTSIEIPLEYPRAHEIRFTAEFQSIRKEISCALRDCSK